MMEDAIKIIENMNKAGNKNNNLLGKIVNKYYLMIRPALKLGYDFGAKAIITEARLKLGVVSGDDNTGLSGDVYLRIDNAYWTCQEALACLNEAANRELKGDELDAILFEVESRFDEMDGTLGRDSAYLEGRGVLKWR